MALAGVGGGAEVTLFITKVWGFGDPAGPLQFASEGWRQNALGKLKDGDRVVLVGTQGSETDSDERGRLLGIMEPTSHPVRSLDFDLRQAPADFDEAGNYKWPLGLHNRRAWLLLDRPRLSDISGRAFHMDSAQGIVALDPEEARTVDGLARREVPLLPPRAHAAERIDRAQGGSKRKGPPPSTTIRRGVMHMRRAPAYTYAMELIGAQPVAIKVGWAFDPKQRRDQFNRAAMPELGGLRYRLLLSQLWDTARLAYAFEQSVLRHFSAALSSKNGEVIVGLRGKHFEADWVHMVRDALRGG